MDTNQSLDAAHFSMFATMVTRDWLSGENVSCIATGADRFNLIATFADGVSYAKAMPMTCSKEMVGRTFGNIETAHRVRAILADRVANDSGGVDVHRAILSMLDSVPLYGWSVCD
jgi:hypothetical protein